MRDSIFKRFVALGFIFLVLLGNYWLVLYMSGAEVSPWIYDVFLALGFWVIINTVGMIVLNFCVPSNKIFVEADSDVDAADSEAEND